MAEETVIMRSKQEYHNNILITKCDWCGTSLEGQPCDAYDHDAGWNVEGYDKKQWLSIRCPKCGYDWSLEKLKVPRNC